MLGAGEGGEAGAGWPIPVCALSPIQPTMMRTHAHTHTHSASATGCSDVLWCDLRVQPQSRNAQLVSFEPMTSVQAEYMAIHWVLQTVPGDLQVTIV